MQRRTWLIVTLAAALAVPGATASWGIMGAMEPDTKYDHGQWGTADTDVDGLKVYFNAVSGNYVAAHANPNAAGTNVAPFPLMYFQAYLGIWKDCNGDGFIGYGPDGTIMAYRSELLIADANLDSGACPDGSPFNKGGWVYELLPIGPTPMSDTSNSTKEENRAPLRGVNDTDARVWGDFGYPGSDKTNKVHFDCAQAPFPQGTLATTGGLIVYADCQTGYTGLKTWNSVAPGDLRFDNPYRPQDDCDNPLNVNLPGNGMGQDKARACNTETGILQPYTKERENAGDEADPAFDVWDCSGDTDVAMPGGQQIVVQDPTGGILADEDVVFDHQNGDATVGTREGNLAEVPGVNVNSIRNWDGSGSLAQTADRAYQGALQDSANSDYDNGHSHCNYDKDSTRLSGNLEVVESRFSGTNPGDGKRLTDFPMTYSAGTMTTINSTAFAGPVVAGLLGYDMTGRAGTQAARHGAWSSNYVYLPPTYMGGTVREDDRTQAAGGMWFTFYARVGAATTGLGAVTPAAGAGIYGAETCKGATSGTHNGWDCDATHWWNPAYGVSEDDVWVNTHARPGWAYQLRDVDCFDGTVVAGVHASLATLSAEEPCLRWAA